MKNLFAILRYTTVVALMASAFVFSGCKDDDDAGPVTFDGSIYAFITQDQFKQAKGATSDVALDSLVMYLDKFPDLKAELSSTTELTLFAPSNDAFKNLTALPGLTDPDKVNQDIIKAVLAYHIVNGKKTSADLTSGASIATQYAPGGTADVIKVNDDGTLLTGSSNDKIVIHTKDQLTTNGVVHTTETVLIPTVIGANLKNILGTLAATVLLGSDFTYMAQFIYMSEEGATAENSIIARLSDKTNKSTLLAIPNAIFQIYAGDGETPGSDADVQEWMAQFSAAEARDVLQNHIILKAEYVASDDEDALIFKNGGLIEDTMSGKVLTSIYSEPAECHCAGVIFSANAGASIAPILIADVDTEAGISNGVMQVVGGIILN